MIEQEAARLAFRLLTVEQQAYLDFQRIYRRLFLAIFRSLNIPPFVAEDLAQSAITDICLKVSKWNPNRGNFDGWVRTVARNIGLEWLREQAEAEMVPLLENFDRAENWHHSIDPQREEAVHDALAKLSPSDRILIELREFELEDQSYLQISETLTRISGKPVTVGALRVRHKRALERLRELLSDDPRIKFRHLETKEEKQNEQSELPQCS